MIFNMTGGGGAELNFTVLGGTSAPANPKENTIWVNTDAEITGWEFSDITNPSWEMPEGYVYINYATCNSTTARSFNALKKNSIWISVCFAKQRVNGVWLSKEIRIYQGGSWKDFRFYLFNNGERSVGFTSGGNAIDRDVTLDVGDSGDDTMLGGYFRCGPIDLTNYKTLHAVVSYVSGVNFWLGVSDKTSYQYDLDFIAVKSRGSAGELEIDISSISGSHYVAISCLGDGMAKCAAISLSY